MGSEKRIENIRAGSVILKGVRETIDKSRSKVSLVERLDDVGAEEKEKTNVEKLEQALFDECDNLLEKISNINSDEDVEACKN